LSKTFAVGYLGFRGEGSRGYLLFWNMALGRCIIGTRHVETAWWSVLQRSIFIVFFFWHSTFEDDTTLCLDASGTIHPTSRHYVS